MTNLEKEYKQKFLISILSTQIEDITNGIPQLKIDEDKATELCYKLARKMSIEFLDEILDEIRKGMLGATSEELFDKYIKNNNTNIKPNFSQGMVVFFLHKNKLMSDHIRQIMSSCHLDKCEISYELYVKGEDGEYLIKKESEVFSTKKDLLESL